MDPLSNPLILSNIFEQLPLDEKKSFRQVSLLWEDSTLQSWRNNALVKIVKERSETNSNSSFDSDETSSEGITLKEFVELLKDETEEPYRFSETKPFRSFQLQRFNFPCPPDKTKAVQEPSRACVEYLFEKIGPTIHHLQLDSSVLIRNGKLIDAFKWILLKACVNLKELHIDPIISPDKDRHKHTLGHFVQEKAFNLITLKLEYLNFYPWWKYAPDKDARELWNIIPNLKNLDLKESSGALDLITQLKHPLDSGKFIKLERLKLQISNFRQANQVEQLVELTSYIKAANPPLTKIYLKFNIDKLRKIQDSFKAFLESCRDTLTFLTVLLKEEDVATDPTDWIIELSGVTLPNLTCLYLQYESNEMFFERDDDEEEFRSGPRNFDFGALQGFSKLKKLTVRLYGYGKTENENEFPCGRWLSQKRLQYGNSEEHSMDDGLVRNELMEDFTFWSFQKFDCESLKKLAGWMPSIKYLAVDADETTLPAILKSFSQLKKLSLMEGSSGDALKPIKTAYPGIEIDRLDYSRCCYKCKMPEYF